VANITTTTAAAVIPELWSNTALSALRDNIVLAKRVIRDSDIDAAASEGDTVHVSVPGTFTANPKTANANVTLQAPTDAKLTIALNNHMEVSFLVEDPARTQSKPAVLQARLRNALIPLANAIEDSLFALYTGFSNTLGTAGTDLDRADIIAAKAALDDVNAPTLGRFGIMSSKDEVALLSDTNLATYFANTNPEAIREGSIGRLYGFDLFMSHRVPVVAGTPDETFNFFGTPEAMVLAMRPMPTDANNAQQSTVVDPESGLAIRQTISYNVNALGWQFTYDVLWGVAEYRDECGLVFSS
jgi:hypothetical protein